MSQARSLWRLELARTKWSGGFINWCHPMRIRHITTGRYLGVNDNKELCLVSQFTLNICNHGMNHYMYCCPSIVFIINSLSNKTLAFLRPHFVCVKQKMKQLRINSKIRT